MNIELNDLIATLDPDPIRITVGDGTYAVNDLTIAEVTKLQELGKQRIAQLAEFLPSIFANGTPPAVGELINSFAKGDAERLGVRQKLIRQVQLIYAALMAAIAEVGSAKKLDAAIETLRTTMAANSESSPSSAD